MMSVVIFAIKRSGTARRPLRAIEGRLKRGRLDPSCRHLFLALLAGLDIVNLVAAKVTEVCSYATAHFSPGAKEGNFKWIAHILSFALCRPQRAMC